MKKVDKNFLGKLRTTEADMPKLSNFQEVLNCKIRIHKTNFLTLGLLVLFVGMGLSVNAQSEPPEGTPYITLTVTENEVIKIDIGVGEDATPVWIETSEGAYVISIANQGWTGVKNYVSHATEIKVHGNLLGFDCSGNGEFLTDISFSEGMENCLREVYAHNNSLTSLDVTKLKELVKLGCSNSNLKLLKISGLSKLEAVWCNFNNLTELKIDNLNKLKYMECYGNRFSTLAIDKIFCALPDRTSAVMPPPLYLAQTPADDNNAAIMASNVENATQKNWGVWYYTAETAISTTGTYKCGDIFTSEIDENISFYPNPVTNVLYIDFGENFNVEIYNMLGELVLSKKCNEANRGEISINKLLAGTYIVKIITPKETVSHKIIKE